LTVRFLTVTSAEIPLVVSLMAGLYAETSMVFDANVATVAMEGLLGGAWLIEADGVIAGYFVVTVGYSLEFHGRFGLLDEFFIVEDFRSRGIGAQALAFIFDWCRSEGMRVVRLETGHDNPRAIALYRRSGFEIEERHLMTKWP